MSFKLNRRTAAALSALSPVEMDAGMRELAELAVRYPFRWFPMGKVARICGFSEAVLTAMTAKGAPVVARKCNPHLLHKWLEENVDRVGKIRSPFQARA
jgi:hypothetical protein